MPPRKSNKSANIWTARIIPVILLGIIVYSSWVLTRLVCVDYLINPSPHLLVKPRVGAAIAILIIYYFLLIFVILCFARLIYTILRNPGFVEQGTQWYKNRSEVAKRPRSQSRRRMQGNSEKLNAHEYSSNQSKFIGLENTNERRHVEEFFKKKIFVCNYDGRPTFCSTCFNFKPDRAHHCSEVDRCVRKMDHFCPWVGGIISETSFKSFIQFNFYAACMTLTALIVLAVFFGERRAKTDFLNVHWVLVLAFAALFFLFTSGMCMSSFQLALINSTTIDNLSRKVKTYYLAVLLPRPEEVLRARKAAGASELRTITYPRPPEEMEMIMQRSSTNRDSPPTVEASNTPAIHRPEPSQGPDFRTFAIIELRKGMNPWDLGPFKNAQEVMGYTISDWLLPIAYSPCTMHDDPESMYKIGLKMPDFSDPDKIEDIVDGRWPPLRQHKTSRRLVSRPSSGRGDESDRRRSLRRHSSSRKKHRRGEDMEAQ